MNVGVDGNLPRRKLLVENHFGNVLMRQNQIASSLGNPINDGTGLSNGMFGDFFKLAGERLNQFQVKLGDILGGPLGGTQN